jgi:hypothetical protein
MIFFIFFARMLILSNEFIGNWNILNQQSHKINNLIQRVSYTRDICVLTSDLT